MSSVVAIVKSIVGQVFVISPEGARRVLVEGDRLFAGDQIDTGMSGAVSLELADGRTLDLGRDTQWSADLPDSSLDLAAATEQAAPSVAELQQAIAAGADPTTDLEATAAGATAAGNGAAGGGHSFVVLDATAGRVDPTIGFPTGPLGQATSTQTQLAGAQGSTETGNLVLQASTLTLSATPTITEAGGVLTYTATVTQAPTSNLNITLSNGAVITIVAGQTTGTVNVPLAPNDSPYIDPSQISVTVTGTTGGNNLVLTIDPNPAVTQITDTIDTTTVTLTAGETVTEGGQITYTATLTNPAQTPVTVTLSNGSVITIKAGESVGTVVVDTPANDVYNNGSTVSTTITGASGGNFENLVPSTTPAVTTITDSIDNTTVSLTADKASVVEGGDITYTATLTNKAQTDVTVTLSNGQTITIKAGETVGSTVFQTPANDVYNNGSTVSTTIAKTEGGNFENLVTDPKAAETTITDSIDNTTVSLTADKASVVEGGDITYTATLTNKAQTDVTVTLSNGQTITIKAGETVGSTVFQTPANDVYNNGSTVSTTIAKTEGGNFENLVTDPKAAETTITDSIDNTTVSLTADKASVVEGGDITYTATLTNKAQTDVTVTLSNGQTITIKAGETTGSTVFNTPANDVYNNGSTVSTTIAKTEGGNFENLVTDPKAAETAITDSIDNTTVSLTADKASVVEGGDITYTATLTNKAQTDVTVTLSNGQTITIKAGETVGSTVFNTPANDVYNNGSTVSTTIAKTEGGNFENLVTDPKAAETTITDSIDNTTVSLTADKASVVEGGDITYTATLTNKAQTDVTVTLSNGQTITIKAGETTGSTVFNTPANDVYNNGSTVSTTIAKTEGGNFENLVTDPKAAETAITDSIDNTTVSLTADKASVVEGGDITYTVTLTNKAQTDVTVTLSNGQTITIKAGETVGSTVFSTPANDVYNNGSTVSTTIAKTEGGNFENLVTDPKAAETTITDSIDNTTVSLSADKASVVEGGDITYTATLTNKAQTDVTVTLSNGQTITIKAGETVGSTVFNTPANDVYNNGSTVSTTIAKTEGGNFENLVTDPKAAETAITDSIDNTTVSLSADKASVVEGGDITYTATLTNKAQTDVTVTLSNGQTITIKAGETTGSTVFNTPANDVYNNGSTVSTTISKTEGGNFENLVTDPKAAETAITDSIDNTTVSLSADKASVVEGGDITYTATLTNKAQTDVTVTLSNGQTITIKAGETTGSTVFNTPANDVYNNGSTVSTTIAKTEGGNFENLVTDPKAAETTITDSIDNTTVSLTADKASVVEGGDITYTATLTNKAQTDVTVTLSNGQTITIKAGETVGSTVFQTPANDVYNNGSTVSTTIAKTEGGNFENLVTDPKAAETAITDSIDNTTVSLTADKASVVEGGDITYTATLTNKAQTDVTVTLSNGQTITIKAGETTGSTVFNTPANDVYNNGSTVSTTIAKTEGGNFENLVTDPKAAETTITDSIDNTTVSLSADKASVVEGGDITYTATLTNKAQTDVTVTLSNGQTITIKAGETVGSTVFNTPANDVYNNGSTVSTTIAKTEGGNFENLVTDPKAAETAITDSIDNTTVSLSADKASVVEGGDITYTATLTNKAQTDVTVTLSNGQTITIKAGETVGSTVFNTPANDVYNNGSTVSTTIAKTEGGNFENLVTDPKAAVTSITDSIDNTTVSLTADKASVVEGGDITYTATLTNKAQTDVTVTLSNGQTITIKAGETVGSTVFQTPANDVYNNGSTVSTTIAKTAGGNFENLVTDPKAAETTITDSIDNTTVSLSADKASVVEGGDITYTATLTNKAQTDVTVTLSNGQTITIKAGETTGSTVFNTPANDVYNNGSTVSTTIAKTEGGNFENLVTDPKAAETAITDSIDNTTVSLTADKASVVEGGDITYTATLTNKAQTDVTVTLSNGQTITIKAGETVGSTVFNTPANDVYNNGSTVSTTIAKTEGGNFENLVTDPKAAVTSITDSIDNTTVSLTADKASVVEGGDITYTATLTNKAQTDVTVTLSNGQTITIKAGETVGSTVFNTPANDVYNNGSTVSTTIAKTEGGNFENLVTDPKAAETAITDSIDNTTVSLTADKASVVEGGDITYTATLTNKAQTDVTVTLSNGQTITIKAGETTGSTVFNTPANDVYNNGSTVSTTIAKTEGGNFENLVTDPKAAETAITDSIDNTTVSLTADKASVVEGGDITYTATLTNKAQTDVTVTLSNGQTITIKAGETVGSTVFNTPANDVYNNGSTVSTTIAKTEGGNFENLVTDPKAAVTSITDSIDNTTVSLTADKASVVEGGDITYTATLTNKAQTDVTVTLSNGQTITIKAGETVGSTVFNTPANDVYNNGSTVSTTIAKTEGGNFENLVTDPKAAETAITDSIDNTTVSLTADKASVVEGGDITYTATLTNKAQTDVTVTLSNGQTITIKAGETTGSTVFNTPANDVYNNGSTVSTTIAKTEGGNFENLVTDPKAAETAITDSIDNTTVSLSADKASVVEGGDITYTATLTNKAQTDVTVTLSNGQTITIKAGDSAGSTVFNTPANDVYNNGSTVSTTIAKTEGGNFENLVTDPKAAETTITDSIDNTTVSLSADKASVVEGGDITYTATLTNKAQTDVTVTLSNGQTITIKAGETVGSTVFNTPANDVYNNGSTVSTTIAKTEGGNFENLVTDPKAAETTITDSIDNTTVSLSADKASVVEGGDITYTATLTNKAQTDVTVTLSNGQTITIKAGETTGSTVFNTPANDVYNNGSTVSTTIAKTEGGNFENLVTDPKAAETAITDSIDNTTVSLTADKASVVEGGDITYTATLTNKAQTDVTVTLSNGQTITIKAGETVGSTVFNTPANDVYNNGSTVSTTIAKTEGGNFENLVTDPKAAETTITDSIDNTTVSLSADKASVVEGGDITYTATLTNKAQTDVTVTLSNGQTITIKAGETTGSTVFNTPANDVYNNGSTVSTTIAKTEGGNFENLVTDPKAAVTSITDSIDNTTVSLTADKASVIEGGDITYTATLTNKAQTDVTVTLSNGQTITIKAGETVGSTVFNTPANDVYNNGSTVSTTIAKTEGGNFENLVTDPKAAVTSITDSIDNTTVSLTADKASVVEGGDITYTATLTNKAQTDVTVTLSNGQTITIKAGETVGSTVFNTPANDVYNNGSTVSTTIAKTEGGNFENLVTDPKAAVTSITDSIDNTTVSLSADKASVVEGGDITYTATLTNKAQTDVTVTLSNGQTITIKAGDSAGSTVFHTPANDVYNNGSTVSTTIAKTAGGNFENLVTDPKAAVTSITDSIDNTTVSLTADKASVVEGGDITYTATLTNKAQTDVTVTLSNGQTITIKAGETVGSTVFNTPANDVYNNGSTVSTTIAKTEGGNFENLVTDPKAAETAITDSIDNTTVSLTADKASVVEGGDITYTATLTNKAQTDVTVTLSNGQTITIKAGETTGSTVFNTPANDVYNNGSTVSTTIAKTEGGNFENLVTDPKAAETAITDSIDNTTVSLTADKASVVEGGDITYTATLTNKAQTDVTVTLSNGQTITIKAGETTGSTVFNTPANDVYNNGSTVSTTIAKTEGGNFENLVTDPKAAVTSITDSIDNTTVSLTADKASVVEGGDITYTATLTNKAQTDVTVTLSNGQTITIKAGETVGSTVFNTPANDVYNNGSTVSTTIAKTEGGNFENLVTDPKAAETAITDSIDNTTVSLTADKASVVEGGDITYTATLTNKAQTDVTVTLSNGQTITIKAGDSAGSTVFNTPANDVYNNGSTVSTTIAKTEGGNFENLVTDPKAAETAITDSIDNTTVSLTADKASVVEGGDITYTATLTNKAQTDVTVTLSNGQTITIKAGETVGSTVFNTPANDVYNNGSTVSTTIAKTEGGNFENLVTDPKAAETAITDSIDNTTVSLTADKASVVEGGDITYTATLTNKAQTDVTVTLSNGQTITIKAGETVGSTVFNTPANDVYNNGSTVSTTIAKTEGGNFENLVTDPKAAETTITDSIDNTTVSLTADKASVVEGGDITYTATLTNKAQTDVTVTLSNGQTITIKAGDSAGSTVFHTPANDVYNNGSTVSTTIAKTAGGNFENLVTDPKAAVTTISDSIDNTTVSLTADKASVVEGGDITYTATLTNKAQTDVTVTLSNGQTITIKAGDSAGSTVFHTPANDVYNNGSTVSTTIAKTEGGNFENLVTDPKAAETAITDSIDNTTVSLTADKASVVEGGDITYTATLTNKAQTDVTVTLSNGQTITIKAGETVGSTVFNTPANDVYNNGSTVSTTIAKTEGGNFENLVTDPKAAETAITDSIDNTTVSLSADKASVVEGGDITYTATLTNKAQTDVTVTLSNGQTITIKAGETTGSTVFNTPANDVYNNGSTVSTTIAKTEGGNFENLVTDPKAAETTITDSIDNTTVSLTADKASVVEGGDITYTATLTNKAQTDVTVTLSNGQTITIKAGDSAGSTVFHTPANDVYNNGSTVSTTIAKTAGGNFENLVTDPKAAVTSITDSIDNTTVSLTADKASVVEGGDITYTATLTNKAQTDVTVTLSNGQTITIKAGDSAGSTVFHTPTNDVYNNGSTVSTTIAKTEGGNFENLVTDPKAAVTSITDSIDNTTVSLTADKASVIEGGDITYTATLTNKAQTDVTVTLSNGQTITIKAGETVGSTVFNTPANDVYNNGSTVSTTIAKTEGGNFENLVTDPKAAVTSITDSIDNTTVSLAADKASVIEGGDITYTATLTNKAQTDVTVTLSNGQTITIKAGDSAGSTVFHTPANDVYNNGSTVSTTIAKTAGGNFENLVTDPKAAVTSITDSIDNTTVSLTADKASVVEGGNITYTATLTNKAQTDVTVTLSNGQTITIKAGDSAGSTVFHTPANDVYNNSSTISTTITKAVGGNFENLVTDPKSAVTSITDSIDNTTVNITGDASVTEGGTAHYTLTLSNPAQTDVTVTLKYSGTATDGSDFTGVYTVKIPAGASSVAFDVRTIDDKITEPTESLVITIDKTTGGNFENLVIGKGSVTTNIIDNDAPPVIDLDANNSSGATGADYKVTFTEGTSGPGVSIADTDIKITDPDSTMLSGATITLTNAQAGDALNLGNSVNGIIVSTNNQTGTITLTLSGSATLADYMQRIQNITFTNNSHDPSTTPRTITVTVTDGGNYSNVATTTVNVVAVNDAPVATGSAVTGTEDTPLALTWANFGVTDVDSPQASLGVKITDLPVAGKLQYLAADGTTWTNVTAGQTFTKAQIDGGQLRFMPNANESGADGYGGTGIGNKQADYAQFKFQPTDGKDLGTSATVKVDITPVADAPTLNVADNNVNSVGLLKQSWNSIAGIGSNGNGASAADLKKAIDNAGAPNSSGVVTNVESSANVAAGAGSKISGLIYMEAGKTYTFSGTGDDSLVINVGGKDVASAQWGTNSGKFSGSITPTVSGYYSLEIYHANQSGPGSYDVNLSVNGAPATDLSTSGVPLYTGITDLTNAGVTVSDLHGSNGDGYYVGYKLNEGQENGTVKLSKVTTALTDTDGSETLSVKISGVPAGSVLTDASGHTFTATKTVGEVNVTGWDLNTLTIKPPTYYSGQFNLTVTSTSTESLGGSAVTTAQLPVTVYPATYSSITGTSGSDAITGSDGNDIVVADIGGLNVVQGKNYNIAFMVDSSGSMSTASINAAKASLTSVFNSLKDSLGANTSGTVNIFLADFDTQVNKSVAINLNDQNALTLLKSVLDSMVSGGGTNYEDVFKTTANFFQSGLATGNTGATNLTYFITDGQPTYYQSGEQSNPTIYNVKLDDLVTTSNYTLGTTFGKYLDNTHYFSIDSSGSAQLQTWNGSRWVANTLGTLHAQGDGTYELSNLNGTGYSTDSATLSNAKSAFALLGGLSQVEAIGINSDVTLNDLKPYDSDGKPQSNIDPKDLANAILGHTEATLPGADTISGGDGNDIIFGDLVSFSGITGEGYNALQAFVAQKTGVAVSAVTTSNVHQYVTEHYADFDVSGAKDGNDTLLGGAGDDILFGQGGNDYLDGGKGNDILLGGTGNDTLIGGPGNDILIGGSGADTFVWKAGDLGNDVIKDFKASEGDRIDLKDLLKGETDSTIDNFLKITTVDGVSTLQVSTEGKLNTAGGLANADVTIKLEGNDWSHTSINSLISGADPTIKIDHTA